MRKNIFYLIPLSKKKIFLTSFFELFTLKYISKKPQYVNITTKLKILYKNFFRLVFRKNFLFSTSNMKANTEGA